MLPALRQVAAYNISDASVFFDNVTATPSLAERIILAPHVYGPNVTVRRPTPRLFLKSPSRGRSAAVLLGV